MDLIVTVPNRNKILVLRKPDIRIGVIIGLIGTSIVEFARDSLELGNIWREVHRELKLEELWMAKKRVKEGKKTSIEKLLNELAKELSTKTPNKENVTAKLQVIDK